VFDRAAYLNEPLPVEKELKVLFPPGRPIIIVEVGACEGEDSIKYSRLFQNAEIYAFEPLPSNTKMAKENFEKYNIHNVRLIEKALSDKNGTAQFFVSNGQPPDAGQGDWDYGNKSSSLLNPAKHLDVSDFITFKQVVTVETITLDEFCENNKIAGIDFMHMDVQGAEMLVLKGAAKNLRCIKAIWLEVSTIDLYKDQPLAEDIEKFMSANGFVMVRDRLYGITGERLYISKFFFPGYRRLFPVWTRRRSLLRNVLRKAGL
jgi:FkbM family methyltransferase